MDHLGDIFFQVDAGDAGLLLNSVSLDIDPAFEPDGRIELGNLVALHEVRIGIILAIELGVFRNTSN